MTPTRLISSALSTVVLLLLALPAGADVLTFEPGEGSHSRCDDAVLHEPPDSTLNDSNGTTLSIDLYDGEYEGETRAVLSFSDAFGPDDGQVSSSADVSRAELYLEVVNEGEELEIYQILESWDVDSVCWAARGDDEGLWDGSGCSDGSIQNQPLETADVSTTGTITIDENRNAKKSATILTIKNGRQTFVRTIEPPA